MGLKMLKVQLNSVDIHFEVFYLLMRHFKRSRFLNIKTLDGQIFHQVEAPATKLDNLNSIPVTHMMEGEN